MIAETYVFQSVFCGHEYTVKNLQFAKSIEPSNDHVTQKLQWAQVYILWFISFSVRSLWIETQLYR